MKSTKSKITKDGDKVISSGKTFTEESLRSYREYQKRFMKDKYRTFIIRLKKEDDKELIKYIEKKENLSAYVKKLLIEDKNRNE